MHMASIQKCVTKTKGVRYRATVRVRGYPSRCATFSKYGAARDWSHKIEDDLRAGKVGGALIAREKTAGDMIRRYIDYVLESKTGNKRFIKAQRKQLEWWEAHLKNCRLANLTAYIINDCKDQLAGKNFSRRSAATVNRYIAALNHVINTAVKEWEWMESNPLNRMSKPKEPRGRVRFLSDAERETLLLACALERRKPLYLIVLFAISTGARKSEILNLKRKDVDIRRQVAVAYDTKNSEPRQLYLWHSLCVELDAWLKRRRWNKSQYVFGGRNGEPMNIETEWRRARKRAGIEDFRFHDLRHTSASYMAMNGAAPGDIAEALGHKSYDMVKRYAHLSKTHVAGVVIGMSEKMLGTPLHPMNSGQDVNK